LVLQRTYTNASLKNIAYFTMLIDHIFAALFYPYLQILSEHPASLKYQRAYSLYSAGRSIGRLSFVLFAFLLVEGFFHTRSRVRYLLQLFVFALISEVPFDLAFDHVPVSWGHQNIYFTLLLGLVAIWAMEKWKDKKGLGYLSVILCCVIAYLGKTDYKCMGVLLIVAFYYFRFDMKKMFIAAGVAMFGGMMISYMLTYLPQGYSVMDCVNGTLSEMFGCLSFLFIESYNGKRGKHMPKMVAYLFYPVHLSVLFLIGKMIKLF